MIVCQCTDCLPGYCNGKGPAAYKVLRQGKELCVCTKCIVNSDHFEGIIADYKDLKIYWDWDSLGALVLAQEIQDKYSNN